MHNLTLYITAATLLLGLAEGCALHGVQDANSSLNNQRRSLPEGVKKTAIENVRVYGDNVFSLLQTICLDAGYIVDIGKCAGASETINGTGKFILPGLVDSHLHLKDVAALEDFMSYGCTTALQMNCPNYTQCDAMAHQPGLSSFIHAGLSSVGNGSLHMQQDPTRAKDTLIYPDTNVTQFVAWQFNNGSDFHKITAEVLGPSLQQQIEMVNVAHEQFQKQTATHASTVMAYEQAAKSRTDGIQHVPDDGLLPQETIEMIKENNQFVTPTLNVFRYSYQNPIISQYMGVEPGSNRTLQHAEGNARALYKAGIPIIVGTDAIGTVMMQNKSVEVPFGLTLHYELQNLVNIVGMTPAEAINAATSEPAKWQRFSDRGSVEVGKRADLLMLNSDPLLNITNTLDISGVWVGGVPVSRIARTPAEKRIFD